MLGSVPDRCVSVSMRAMFAENPSAFRWTTPQLTVVISGRGGRGVAGVGPGRAHARAILCAKHAAWGAGAAAAVGCCLHGKCGAQCAEAAAAGAGLLGAWQGRFSSQVLHECLSISVAAGGITECLTGKTWGGGGVEDRRVGTPLCGECMVGSMVDGRWKLMDEHGGEATAVLAVH